MTNLTQSAVTDPNVCTLYLFAFENAMTYALNSTRRSSLNAVSELKRFFERNGSTVDSEMRDVFVRNIPRAIVTSEQRDIVEEQVSLVSRQRGGKSDTNLRMI